jgi:hypothetical protein
MKCLLSFSFIMARSSVSADCNLGSITIRLYVALSSIPTLPLKGCNVIAVIIFGSGGLYNLHLVWLELCFWIFAASCFSGPLPQLRILICPVSWTKSIALFVTLKLCIALPAICQLCCNLVASLKPPNLSIVSLVG